VRSFVGDRWQWMLETRTASSRQRWIVNRLGVAYSRTPECQGERDAPLLPSEAGDGKDANSVTLARQIERLRRLMGMPRRWRVTGSG
jgi:hypothetical protein